MALTIVVKGERFPLPENLVFTYRELASIRRIAGVEPGEIADALERGNVLVLPGFAYVAMGRAGKAITEKQILDLPVDAIDIEEEEEGDPPLGPIAA